MVLILREPPYTRPVQPAPKAGIRWSCLHFIPADKCERFSDRLLPIGSLLDWAIVLLFKC
ncbi:hypothetical protein MNBD_BACTEROID01-47, partial [hydrothermal vent metagenome]